MSFRIKAYTVVGFLILMNIFLIYSNVIKNRELILLDNEKKISETTQVKFDTSITYQLTSPVQLFVIFPKEYCSICMNMEIPRLKSLAEKYSSSMHFLDIGMNYNGATLIGNNIKITKIKSISDVLTLPKIKIDVPVAFIADRNGSILKQYENDYKNPDNTIDFYEQVRSLFSSIYGA